MEGRSGLVTRYMRDMGKGLGFRVGVGIGKRKKSRKCGCLNGNAPRAVGPWCLPPPEAVVAAEVEAVWGGAAEAAVGGSEKVGT